MDIRALDMSHVTSRRSSASNGNGSSHSNKRKSADNGGENHSKLDKKTCPNVIEKRYRTNRTDFNRSGSTNHAMATEGPMTL